MNQDRDDGRARQTLVRVRKVKNNKAHVVLDTEVISEGDGFPSSCVTQGLGQIKMTPNGKWRYRGVEYNSPEGAGIAILMEKIEDWDFERKYPPVL